MTQTAKPRRGPVAVPLSRKIRYGFETALVYFIYGVFRILPLKTASAFGGRVLQALGPRMGISRVALKNLDGAFPEKSADEKQTILKNMWNNLGRVIAEYAHLSHIAPQVEIEGMEHLLAAKNAGKAMIFWSGHLGNWEATPMMARQAGLDINLIYRKPNNPGVDRLLRYAREQAGGSGHIAKGAEGAREIFSLLKQKKAIGILLDQKLNEGLSVPFFGKPAMTASAAAQFALRFDCVLTPTRTRRLPDGRVHVRIYPPMAVEQTGDRDADVMALLVRINQQLEDWIREAPADWLWIHKRWPDSA
jgi:Kdo2-lipid IVA lauroyltransferase/acyltransferase